MAVLTDRQIGQWLLAIDDADLHRARRLTTADLRKGASYAVWSKALDRAARGGRRAGPVFEHVLAAAESRVVITPHQLGGLLVAACAVGNVRCVELTIRRGASVFSRDPQGRNGLMLAARAGHLDVARILVAAGSAVDMEDKSGMTALHYAVDGLHQEVMAYLRELGADPHHRNRTGESPMSLAACLPELAALLDVDGGPRWYDRRASPVVFYYAKAFGLGFDPASLDTPVLYGGDYNGMMPAYPGGGPWSRSELDRYQLGWFMDFIGRLRRHEDFCLAELLEAAERHGTPGQERPDLR